MKWDSLLATVGVIIVILLFVWPKIKDKPRKYKSAVFILSLISLGLSIFDLQNIYGPSSLIEVIFKPFGKFLER